MLLNLSFKDMIHDLHLRRALCGHELDLVAGTAIMAYMSVGLIAGWLVGVPFFKYEDWKQVPLDRLRVSVVPQRDGRFALGFSVAF